MKRYIYTFLCFAFVCSMQAQQEFGTNFMTNTPQSNMFNPAVFNGYKVSVNLPSVYTGIYNSAFSINDISEKRGDILFVNVENALNKLDDNNILSAYGNVETIGFSIETEKMKFSFNHGVRIQSTLSFPKEMLQFMWGGNSQFVGENINLAARMNMTAYQEYGFGFGYKVSDNLTFGTRFKYLVGNATISTPNAVISVYTDPEYYQLTAETDYLIHTAGIPEADLDNGEFFDFDFQPELFGPNRGYAIDLGANLKINDKLRIQTSVLNLGKINWTEDVNNYWSQGSVSFEGLDFQSLSEEGELDIESIVDSIGSTFAFDHSQTKFSTSLAGQFYLSGIYDVNPSLRVGALLYAQGFNSNLTNAFALNAQKDLGKWATVGAQYAVQSGGVHNLGLSASTKLGPVQIYAMSDNVAALFNPMNAQSTNVRLGMNLLFGKIKPEAIVPVEEIGEESKEN